MNPVHIAGFGARTPLGLQAPSSAAAYRARINGMGEHPFMIDRMGDPMPGALDSRLDPMLMGPARLLALAETALQETCGSLSMLPTAIRPRIRVYLGLPEFRPGFVTEDAEAVRRGLSRIDGLPIEISEVLTFTQGHASGLAALAAATNDIQRGPTELCLVGGVDSYIHPETMEWLDQNRQLVGVASRSCFVPGEGAGFCLLMSERMRKRLRLGKAAARVVSVAVAKETNLIKTEHICLGTALSAVVRTTVGTLAPGERISTVICDINGERYRGEEWGFVCVRLSQHFDDPTAYWSPADSWGDIGAASGPIFAMLACHAAARGYAKGRHTMLWASSECGVRAAAILDTSDRE